MQSCCAASITETGQYAFVNHRTARFGEIHKKVTINKPIGHYRGAKRSRCLTVGRPAAARLQIVHRAQSNRRRLGCTRVARRGWLRQYFTGAIRGQGQGDAHERGHVRHAGGGRSARARGARGDRDGGLGGPRRSILLPALLLAMVRFGQQRYAAALDRYRSLIEFRPGSVQAHSNLGRGDEAIRTFEHALYLDPDLETPRAALRQLRNAR